MGAPSCISGAQRAAPPVHEERGDYWECTPRVCCLVAKLGPTLQPMKLLHLLTGPPLPHTAVKQGGLICTLGHHGSKQSKARSQVPLYIPCRYRPSVGLQLGTVSPALSAAPRPASSASAHTLSMSESTSDAVPHLSNSSGFRGLPYRSSSCRHLASVLSCCTGLGVLSAPGFMVASIPPKKASKNASCRASSLQQTMH